MCELPKVNRHCKFLSCYNNNSVLFIETLFLSIQSQNQAHRVSHLNILGFVDSVTVSADFKLNFKLFFSPELVAQKPVFVL